MNLDDFDFDLPEDRIAQRPEARRDASRLLVVPGLGAPRHARFAEVVERLEAGDLLVLNDTRVRPARIRGVKPGGGKVEALLLSRLPGVGERERWEALLRGAPAAGGSVELSGRSARVLRVAEGRAVLEFAEGEPVTDWVERVGSVPLPPYIRRGVASPEDGERYQTVYAARPGAVAAPTAGLHFTRELLEKIARRRVDTRAITLHVGPGTFLPIRSAVVEEHRMHGEDYEIPEATAEAVAATRSRGGRVVAVGTTVVRALESAADEAGRVTPGRGRTTLFVRPGYRFRVVDRMLTNFHLPRSTLLLLVAAFAGRERVLAAYRIAIAHGYRFYSYGDAMWLEGAPDG